MNFKHNLNHLKSFRKELRNNSTPAEAKLWTYLKNRQLDGRKFRRQFSISDFILDFYCPDEFLAIELDGESHSNPLKIEYDFLRDNQLMNMGIRVLRFENKMVWNNLDGLLEEIRINFSWKPKEPLSPTDSSP